jgi:hypothetical protein
MKTYNLLLHTLCICLTALFLTETAYPQAAPSKDDIQELKQMILELKKENAARTEELEKMKKENAEKIQSLENRIDELTTEQPKTTKPASEEKEGEKEGVKEERYAAEDDERDIDEEDFFERINAGDKPYKKLVEEGPFKLTWEGYADILFSWYNYGPDQTRPGGSGSDNRLEFDLTRFVLELEGEMFAGLGFEAEIEFEHGGTGSAFEVEYEEFGEYEQEVEKGGEVYVEELYLYKKFSDWGKLEAGRFYLAFGLMSFLSKPTDYLAARRPESETNVIPAVWDEMGASFEYYVNDNWDLTFQVVNGLDSTGFGSLNWITEGHQGKFETIKATGLALVGRVDFKLPNYGLLVGTSAYYGIDTSANRPKDDLPDVDAPLLLLDAHAIFEHGRWRGSGDVIWGHLWDAEEVSERNKRLSNNLDVPRTAVSDNAFSSWGEIGYNINTYVGLDHLHRLEPFVRVDYYDTFFNPRDTLFDNPRYERTVFTGGLSYTFVNSIFVKIDYAYRMLGSSDFNSESGIDLAFGWVY